MGPLGRYISLPLRRQPVFFASLNRGLRWTDGAYFLMLLKRGGISTCRPESLDHLGEHILSLLGIDYHLKQ